MTVAGIGCRRGASGAEVLAAIAEACAALGVGRLDALAAVPAKRQEPGIAAAARALGLPLVTAAAAAEDRRLATRSAASLAATGTPSASEAAALGAAGPGARLLAPRRVVGRVTCAIATGGDG